MINDNELGPKADFAMGKSVQESTVLNMLRFNDNIAISTAGCGSYNVLVEGKWDEHNKRHEIDHSANCTHSLWAVIKTQYRARSQVKSYIHLGPTWFCHIFALQSCLEEYGPKPSYQAKCRRKYNDA
jgi:hypothetical protein